MLTDPYSQGEFFDATLAPWVGEVGDICNFAPWWTEGGFRFAAIWSNTAAAAGGSPRVPWAGPSVLGSSGFSVGNGPTGLEHGRAFAVPGDAKCPNWRKNGGTRELAE